MSNQQLQKQEQQIVSAKSLFARDDVKQKFQELLGKRSVSFMTSVLQIVASNKDLSRADPNTVYHAAAVAATLDLPINNNLGFAYIIPYEDYKTKIVTAQFQMGYKGFIQLAQRSGQFKSIYAAPILDGQIVSENPLDGFEFDFTKKGGAIVGYASKFRLLNGFEAVWYMTNEKLQLHALKYSQTYKSSKDWVKAKSLWTTDFDGMAQKTVLKLLLSKFAPLSVEMQTAIINDQAVINDTEGNVSYPDNEPEPPIDKEAERVALMISDCKTIADLVALLPHVPDDSVLMDLYLQKRAELGG
jgi:recombination protein RecT